VFGVEVKSLAAGESGFFIAPAFTFRLRNQEMREREKLSFDSN